MTHEIYEDGKHHWLFIAAYQATGTDGHERHRIQVCRDCGKFEVFGDKDGVYFDISFELPTDELVEAAGQYAKRLSEGESVRLRQPKAPQLPEMDDFFGPNPDCTGKDPYTAFGEWAAANGYDLDDDSQLRAAIEAYGDDSAGPPLRVTEGARE